MLFQDIWISLVVENLFKGTIPLFFTTKGPETPKNLNQVSS